MSKVRVNMFSISIDGYGAGPGQDRENPLGRNGDELHEWIYPTPAFQERLGKKPARTSVDDAITRRGMQDIGAWILGRNMFGPVRGPWPDEEWKGWWGENPPYHVPVFVLTHHPRRSVEMKGGTTFHFVTDGIHSALEQARTAANGKDVRIGGGTSVVRQYLEARLIDELHIAVQPVFLGAGEHLFHGLDLRALGFECTDHASTSAATHYFLARR